MFIGFESAFKGFKEIEFTSITKRDGDGRRFTTTTVAFSVFQG